MNNRPYQTKRNLERKESERKDKIEYITSLEGKVIDERTYRN